jgi:acid phosphatase
MPTRRRRSPPSPCSIKDAAGALPAAAQNGDATAGLGARWAAGVASRAATSRRSNYFGDGKFYAVNTMQPAYQPSGNAGGGDASGLYADPEQRDHVAAADQATIGDRLDAKHMSWAWYAGAWNAALADGSQPPSDHARRDLCAGDAGGSPDFQPHHQPFNYYATLRSELPRRTARARILKDYQDLLADIAAGRLPAVVFYKPQGNLNQHAGYASIAEGDAHIADLVAKLRASPQWSTW